MDIDDFYLGTPLPQEQQIFVPIPVKCIPPEVIAARQLQPYVDKGQVWMRVEKTIFGMPQAGYLSKLRLDTHLAAHGYTEHPDVACLYSHESNGTQFVLVVDDFAVSCQSLEAKQHLMDTMASGGYIMKYDHAGSKFVGLTIELDRHARTLTLSMPGYVEKMEARFAHRFGALQNSPMIYTPPKFGAHQQEPSSLDTSPRITDAEIKENQAIIGCGLFFARMIDAPTLTAVCALASEQAAGRASIMPKIQRYLGYLRGEKDIKVVYHASDMVLTWHTDGSYLSVPGARSRAGVFAFFGWADDPTRLNGPTCCQSQVIDVVTGSAAETEYGALYIGGQNFANLRTISAAMRYPQNATIIFCDNTCAVGIANRTQKPSKSKAMDMRFHWIRDRIKQGQFRVLWAPGKSNIADFFTKALPVYEHQRVSGLLTTGRVFTPTRHRRASAHARTRH
jgi:hypothetical protein